MTGRDVAVVGMACVFPDAADMSSYWRNLVNGVDAIRDLPPERWAGSRNLDLPPGHAGHIACRRGGFVPLPFLFDPLRFKVMPNVVRDGDVDQFVILRVLADALEDAGIGEEHACRRNADVIVGRGVYHSNKMVEIFLRADLMDRLRCYLGQRFPQLGENDLGNMVEEIEAFLPSPDVDTMATAIPNLVASRAANRLDLRGTAYMVDAACASSLLAVEHGVRRLREGLCDVALACGANFSQVPAFWYLFTQIRAVSPSGQIRPFDRDADGLVIGEGAGAVVLKRLEDARRDGDRVYAVVRGAGSSSDGRDAGILAPSSAGQVLAFQRAYRDAGIDPDTIGLLEAHGTGTLQGDLTELRTIKTFFGSAKSRHATRAMGSVKSMIGHTMPAAGIASFIKTVLALSNKILPPSLHCERPHPELEDAAFYVNTHSRPWMHPPGGAARRAGVSAFGFGGINCHVVLEEAVPGCRARAQVAVPASDERLPDEEVASPVLRVRDPRPALNRPSELLAFAGKTPGDVTHQLRRAARFLTEDRAPHCLEDLAYTLIRDLDTDSPCRLAFIAESLESLPERLEEIARRLGAGENPDAPHSMIFYRGPGAPERGAVAAVFPGLGFPGLVGHYTDHLMASCAHFPPARSCLDRVEHRDDHDEDPLPTSFLLQPPSHLSEAEQSRLRHRFTIVLGEDEDLPRPDERKLSAMGMLVSNWAGWSVLEAFRIPFDMLCGQSLGDISAICASGMVDFDDVIPRIWPYLSVDTRFPDLGCLAFAGCSEDVLAPLLQAHPQVSVALYTSPEALIVGGPDAEIDAVVQALRKRQVIAQKLPFPPMHTPLMSDKQREWADLEGDPIPLREPRIAVYSTATESPMPSDVDQLRSLVASNVTRPLRFVQTLRRMYRDGARIFVQVGPGSLALNIKSILTEPDVVCAALDVDYRDPVTQLQLLAGTLFGCGVPLDLTALFQAREPVALPIEAPRPRPEPARGVVALDLYRPPMPPPDMPAAFASPENEGAADAAPTAGRSTATSAAAVPAAPETGGGDEAEGPLPLIGRVLHFDPGRELVQERRFSLDEDLYLRDHALACCEDLKPARECFPVVPLSMELELLAETAACLTPGRGLIGFRNVRARKWLALDHVDAVDVRVEARAQEAEGDRAVVKTRALLDDVCLVEADVHLARHYRMDVDLHFSELTGVHPFPLSPERMYAETFLFHGPRFQCIDRIRERGDQGIVAEVAVSGSGTLFASNPRPQLLLDPVTTDGAGQVLGAMFFDRPMHIFPLSVEQIEFYRPTPPTGTRVPVRVEVVGYDEERRQVEAMMEIQDGRGQVWFRVSGWRDIIFRYATRCFQSVREPRFHPLARQTELDGVPDGGIAVVLPRALLKGVAQSSRLPRVYLGEAEWREYLSLEGEPRRQKEWLMGRAAIKDAARLWLARRTGEPLLHPAQIAVGRDEGNRPFVRMPEGCATPAVSVTHTEAVAAAVAADKPVGIDAAALDPRRSLKLEDFASEDEIRVIESVVDSVGDAGWTTRVWCGKEAVAKAVGTGLRGRPRAFQTVDVEPDGGLVVEHGDPARRFHVRTSLHDGSIFAVVSTP